MRLVVTGGGTGGHVFPALEIAKAARSRGAEVLYFGSLRGQEGKASARLDFPFTGFRAEPIYSLKSPRGWSSLLLAFRSSRQAKLKLRAEGVEAVFSTGGYSAAPVMQAARSLGIPFVIHEANSVPGRVNRLFSGPARHFTSVFNHTQRVIPKATRTGQPIRQALREAAKAMATREPLVVVIGGSQGSAFLNRTVPLAAKLASPNAKWLHSTGPAHIDAVRAMELAANFDAQPFIEAPALAMAYARASLAMGRSGGTVAEYAVFRLPSVLIPLPTSADDHQLHNAKEFVELGAATLLAEADATPAAIAAAVDSWLADSGRVAKAQQALAAWDMPNATETIADLVMGLKR